MQLKELEKGCSFKAFGYEWTMLEKNDDFCFCICDELVTGMPFRKYEENAKTYKVAPNDFRDSNVKEYLNGEFLKKLKENGMKDDDIVPLSIDLKCTLGQHEYGTDTVQVGLLTLEQYGEYYPIIKKADSWWWLATPWRTPSRSIPAFDNPGGVYYVWSDGGYYDNYCGNSYGVRPVLNFSSSLVIPGTTDNDGEYLLIAKGSEEEFVERYPDNAAAEEAMDQKVNSFLKRKNIEPGSELFDEHCYRDCGWFAYTAQEAFQSYWAVKAPKNAFEELKIELELVNTGMDQANAMPNESVYDACEPHITRIESVLNKLDAEGVFDKCKEHEPCGLFDKGWGRN